jgi:hypothetical protein
MEILPLARSDGAAGAIDISANIDLNLNRSFSVFVNTLATNPT